MPEAAERPAEVAGERPHIGALAALRLEHGALAGMAHHRKPRDLDGAGLQLDGLAVASEIIGALALDLHRREAGRHLLDRAGEAGQERLYVGALGKAVRR